ncbi:protein of unknown function [Cognatiyoonia koreensis]|uniref:DUF4178 domain-containing protein n=1 Tax=Cognatiyoonia koreensis TaxID=364200 RepID=A0A1I0RB66_9RHOB|nr:DUF4178 domain-containing protein [Cognatiyoonia koreensis]SEW38021.1 protein of unknown function [Cognatiyoonia koreensis]
MTRKAALTSINCTSCGAGLDVLGGGRVQTHVCGYCGSQLDAQDHYKVLQKFTDLPRPETPFQIGMQGTVEGVIYTVIGTLGFEEKYRGRTWTWVDHQLYSPTHGYAFLTVENGHFVFTRTYRKATSPQWLTPAMIETMETPPSVKAGGDTYRYYDTSESQITFAEGEFNWQPKIGDRSTTISLMSRDAVIAFSKTDTEEETIRSVYPDQLEIAESFGLESVPPLRGVHRLQQYQSGPHTNFVRNTLMVAMIACFVIYLGMLGALRGQPTQEVRFTEGDLPASIPFDVSRANRIATVRLGSGLENNWAYYEIDVTGPDGETLFETGREIAMYTGRDSDGTWTEGSNETTLRFMPTQTGRHTLTVALSETDNQSGPVRMSARIFEGGFVAKWFLFAGLFFMLIWIIPAARFAQHQRKRWAGWDWND